MFLLRIYLLFSFCSYFITAFHLEYLLSEDVKLTSAYEKRQSGSRIPLNTCHLYNGNGRGYYFLHQTRTYDDALSFCKQYKMDLVRIEDAAHNSWIMRMTNANTANKWWIGLKDHLEQDFRWHDNTKAYFTAWGPNEPNDYKESQGCVELYQRNPTLWADIRCDEPKFTICATETPCPTSTSHDCRNYNSFGHYFFLKKKKTFDQAVAQCRLVNAKMLKIEDSHYNEWIGNQAQAVHRVKEFWTGLRQNKSGRVFKWYNKKLHTDYENWDTGSPVPKKKPKKLQVKNCVEIGDSTAGKWTNVLCTGRRKFICEDEKCPIDGNWGPWTAWSVCSKTCATGTKFRNRLCDNPAPDYFGLDCAGRDNEIKSCKVKNCPVNGNWGAWGTWNECSTTCGRGFQTAYRSCNNPSPQYGGSPCPDRDYKVIFCNLKHCPGMGYWSVWGEWTACLETCGYENTTRNRNCTKLKPDDKNCTGNSTEVKDCSHNDCSDLGQISALMEDIVLIFISVLSLIQVISWILFFFKRRRMERANTEILKRSTYKSNPTAASNDEDI